MDVQAFTECRFAPPISWTAETVRAAELLADTGNLRLAADLCEWLLADETLAGLLDTRIDTLLGFPREVVGGPHAGQLTEDSERFFDEPTWKQFHSWALLLNCALAELTWTLDPETGREVPRMRVWNPRWLRWDWGTGRWLLTVGEQPGTYFGKEIPITPGDGRWILWCPQGNERPWTKGLYRSVARWAMLKALALRGWAIHADKLGIGIMVALGVDGKGDERQRATEKLRSLGTNGAIALGTGADVKIIESSQRTWENFKAQLDQAETGFAMAILGQNATSNASSSSSARVLADVARGRIVFDAENSDTFVHENITVPWSIANWGIERTAKLVRTVETEDDRSKRAAQAQMTAQAAASLKSAGANLDLDTIANDIGLATTNVIKRIQDKIYQYHLEFGIMTKNEVRQVLGLPPIDGGDEPAKRVETATVGVSDATPNNA